MCRYGILNCDDPHYTDMVTGATSINSTYGIEPAKSHDICGSDIKIFKRQNVLGTAFTCKTVMGTEDYGLRMPGEFNVYNALAAIAVAQRMQIPTEIIKKALAAATVRGRFEIVEALPDAVCIVDYAHNALSMRAALETIRRYEPRRLVVLFGSVGGRTELRRAELGREVSALADFAVITSDNPDFEEPENIIADIEKAVGKTSCPYVCITDRSDAVRYAINNAKDGDCILFAGKGHENYQLINGEHVPYDERSEILSAAAIRLAKVN